jgi:hypothetical protein
MKANDALAVRAGTIMYKIIIEVLAESAAQAPPEATATAPVPEQPSKVADHPKSI